MKTDYNKQAQDFLKETGSTLEIVEAVPQTAPLWAKKGAKHGIKYSVTLKNARHAYTFEFWNGIAMGTAKPSEYDIIACLSPLFEDTFEDFCSSFGYDNDSITALKIFEACKQQDRQLRKLYTHDEISKLVEIQ